MVYACRCTFLGCVAKRNCCEVNNYNRLVITIILILILLVRDVLESPIDLQGYHPIPMKINQQ